ncbi:MAG: hypothetical protein AAGC68_12945, partial [Verrucomicrobiota bacterium]
QEEFLDHLPESDPRAIRSRRDLRRINALMGNYRWISREVLSKNSVEPSSWFELGAGDGPIRHFLSPDEVGLTAVDLAPRPCHWPESWDWWQADLFAALESAVISRSGLIANLFLHHFEDEELHRLGSLVNERFNRVVASEPARSAVFDAAGHLLFPFVNDVTRHDMIVSIRAGFRTGELPHLLGLGDDWKFKESITILGAYRLSAWRD